MRNRLPTTAVHRRRNLEAARHILANVERYGGLDAALVTWARRIVAALADEELAPVSEQLRLPGLEAGNGN
jgi:hypothetical protein